MSVFKDLRAIKEQTKGVQRPTLGDAMAARKTPGPSPLYQASHSSAPPRPELTEPGTGTVIACYDTNLYKGDDTLFAFCLFVIPDGGLPYPVTCESGVPDAHLDRCVPGTSFPIVFDRQDPSLVDVRWEAVS